MKPLISPPKEPSTEHAVSPPEGGAAEGSPKSFDISDIKHYFHIVVKRIWLVALCFVISLAIAVVKLVNQVPVYKAWATLLLSQGLPIPDRLQQKDDLTSPGGEIMATQQRVIQSPLILAKAQERLGRPPEDVALKLGAISVVPLNKAAFIAIGVESQDPQFAADFANAIAEAYLDYKAEERMEVSQNTMVSLTAQSRRLSEDLKRAEDRLMAFKRENSVVALQERGNIAADLLAGLYERAAGYKTERMILEAQRPLLAEASDEIVLETLSYPVQVDLPSSRVAATTNASAGLNRPEELIERGVVEQPSWTELKREKASLEGRLASLRDTFKDSHPAIADTIKKLRDVQRRLDEEVQLALRQYYAQIDSLALKEQAVKRAETEWESVALDVSRKADEYQMLQHDLTRLRSLYDLVFSRLKEIDISIGIEPETIKLFERAQKPGAPLTPRRMQSIFMAALIGLGIGLALVVGLEFLDDSMRYPEDVKRVLQMPFLGLIPAANWDPEDVRTHLLSSLDQKSGLAESYRNVRSAFLFSPGADNIRSIVMTSAVPKEGKTTTSINLAISFAQAGQRILLVDSDLRRGEVHKYFGLEGGRGLSDVLAGQAKPESVIQRTAIPNLDLVATGPFPVNPAELFLRGEFNFFLEHVKRTYDRIVFDGPPVMAVSEAAILASLVDGVIMVVWAGQTSRKLSMLSAQILRQRGANMLGCILNNLEFGRVGYYYYSTYYGYYDYGYRYEGRPESLGVKPPTRRV